MLKIGITGGIGSGKTTVAKVFETLGVPVYYADDASKRLMNEDTFIQQTIKEKFGSQAYVDGKLNRSFLASIVFNDAEKLALLNSIIHPAIIADAASWMQQQNAPYVIKEAAILFESGSYKQLDKIIGVYCPLQLRIKRVMQRDNITAKEVQARVQKQMDEDEKMSLCNYVITNDDQQFILPQILKIHQEICNSKLILVMWQKMVGDFFN